MQRDCSVGTWSRDGSELRLCRRHSSFNTIRVIEKHTQTHKEGWGIGSCNRVGSELDVQAHILLHSSTVRVKDKHIHTDSERERERERDMAVSAAAVQCWVLNVHVAPEREIRFEHQGFRLNGRPKSSTLMAERRVQVVQPFSKKQSLAFPSCVTAQASKFAASFKQPGPVIVIDNYDSFTYNLCQYLGDLGCKYEVYRNDEITIEELKEKNPRGILISPGPGTPQDSGIALQSIVQLGPEVPIFGVCMGLQCMGEAYGGKVVRAPNGVVHGKSSPVHYDEQGEPGLLAELSNPFEAARYHSLVIERSSFPSEELEITAWTDDGLIMGVRHSKYRHVQGVQFHPESIITPEGKKIVQNFLNIIAQKWELKGVEQAASA